MPYIKLDETLPGMRSLLAFRPAIAEPLTTLMQILMRSDEGLSKGERELIATFVSSLNGCSVCHKIHGEVAQCLLNGEENLIEKVKENYQNAPISDKMKALLTIAVSVQKNGKQVSIEQVAAAKSRGANDLEIHDTVLISALFCLFNRYIDGLGILSKDTPETLKERGKMIAEMGYSSHPPKD
ncbi:carboxymuconolactone decarboxylase family protein [Emticicia sp. SJ17W-69]|uniref:carboxymuconolactone decarboxylase family protein n=1 Tax=Emticicia sp. SJ17W-69 TaxID=3421657 RepID=UPI003EB70D02